MDNWTYRSKDQYITTGGSAPPASLRAQTPTWLHSYTTATVHQRGTRRSHKRRPCQPRACLVHPTHAGAATRAGEHRPYWSLTIHPRARPTYTYSVHVLGSAVAYVRRIYSCRRDIPPPPSRGVRATRPTFCGCRRRLGLCRRRHHRCLRCRQEH